MSSGQEKIKEFPEDDALWFIKWIDEFQLPHLGTRSASVGVVLQKLPFTDPAKLWSITPEHLLQALGQRNQRDPQVETLSNIPRVMSGTIPLLHIGAVFRNRVKVGELPTQRQQLELLQGEEGGQEVTLGELQPAPPNWANGFPYRLLNKFEYSIGHHGMQNARCLVFRRRSGTYIVPRMVIFKTFYAPHTELAKAFCNGPWSERHKDVICLHDFQSGLKTERTSSGQWNVILQTLVPDSYAVNLALLHFDDYARACAESIYSRSLQDRAGRQLKPWYASAKIPFRPGPLKLAVRGFQLRGWKYKDDEGQLAEHRKFLVTEIVGSTWPDYIPDIGYERANSGLPGAHRTVVQRHKPYLTSGDPKPSGPETEVDGEHDAQADSAGKHMRATEFHWINPPRKGKIKKASSQQYEDDGSRPPRPAESGDEVSTGEHTHQQDARPKGQAEVLIRTPEMRFENILEVFKKLESDGFLDSFTVVACSIPGKLVRRGDLNCWSFIDDESLLHGLRPRRGWRLVEYDPNSTTKCLYRSALVVQLTIASRTVYWIEIECRKKNEGGFRSPVLSNVADNTTDIINAAMKVIVEKVGVNTKAALNEALREYGVHADCYKHQHESAGNPKFDVSSVRRFLSAAMLHR